MGPIGSVRFLTVTTYRTGTGGIARVNRDQHHPSLSRFVRKKAPKLSKGPRVTRTALRPSNRDSLADLRQILDGECLTGRACLLHQRLADAVVDIPLESRLFSCVLAEPPAGAARVGGLEPLAVLEPALAYPLDIRPAVRLALAIGSQVHDAQVNAQEAGWLIGLRTGFGLRHVQVKLPVTLHQFRTTHLPTRVVQVTPLKRTENHVTNHTPGQRIETHAIKAHQAVGAGIVADRAVRLERRTGSVVFCPRCSHGFSRLIPGATGQLCPQPVIDAGGAVDHMVQLVLVDNVLLPRDRGTVGCRRVECLSRGPNGGYSVSVKRQLAAYGTCGERLRHKTSIAQSERPCMYVCTKAG